MPIVVKCQCGKKFKAKDKLAGRKVRCPACREPLRIPAGGSEAGAPEGAAKSKSSPAGVNAEAALLKFEQVQQRKAQTAETEAAYRQEQNKLIESYDQIAGRSPGKNKKQKKGELTEVGVKKVTIFTKLADAWGVVFGTLLVKYAMIVLLASGVVIGSVFIVRKVTGYMAEETASTTPKQDQIRSLYKDVSVAISEGRLSEANTMLQKVLEIDPSKETHGTYQYWRKELDKALARK